MVGVKVFVGVSVIVGVKVLVGVFVIVGVNVFVVVYQEYSMDVFEVLENAFVGHRHEAHGGGHARTLAARADRVAGGERECHGRT